MKLPQWEVTQPDPRSIVTVGVGGMALSSKRGDVLITYSLGSCLGITAYDPSVNVGALLHVMLPTVAIDLQGGRANPYKYVDSGVEGMLKLMLSYGADIRRLVLTAAGGAFSKEREEDDHFQIGKRNLIMLRRVLWERNLIMRMSDTGGNQPRTLSLSMGTGEVLVKSNGTVRKLA